jgi:threonine dehydrogenase-like Zn-dependent dehydrogenase
MKTKRAILTAPGQFDIVTADISPARGELLVKVDVCGLCNWELNHYAGIVGQCPQTLGHEWAGGVVDMGAETEGFSVGDKITVMPVYAGFAEYAVVDYRKAYKLRRETNVAHALGEPLKCVVTVARAAKAGVGDFGVIYGCGPMGLWAIQILAGASLAGLIAIDVDDGKLGLARKYGASRVINPGKGDPLAEVAEITAGHMADFVIEGTGVPELLNTCVRLLRPSGRGRVVLMSSHKRPCKDFDFREMVARSAELVAAHAKYSLDQDEDMRRALRFLEDGIIRMDDIITHSYRLEDIGKAFEDLSRKPKGYIKGVVTP